MSNIIWKFKHDRGNETAPLSVSITVDGQHGVIGQGGIAPARGFPDAAINSSGDLKAFDGSNFSDFVSGAARPGIDPLPDLYRLTVRRGGLPISSVTFQPVLVSPTATELDINALVRIGKAQAATPEQLANLADLLAQGGGGAGLNTEAVQDAVAAMLVAGNGITLNYNDAGNTLTISSTGSGATGPTIVTDDFNRPDGPLGPKWLPRFGLPGSPSTIVGNKMQNTTTQNPYSAHAFTSDKFANGYVQASLMVATGVQFHVNSEHSFWLLYLQAGSVVLGHKDGTQEVPFITTWTASVDTTTPHLYRVEFTGSTIRVLRDGVELTTVTDASSPLNGYAGVYFDGVLGATIDNFEAGIS